MAVSEPLILTAYLRRPRGTEEIFIERGVKAMPMATLEAQREYQKNWIKERRDRWFEENGPCCTCGSWINLELDHEDPSTKISHRVWSWSQERRDKELEKCRALCRICHRNKTSAELRTLFSVTDPTRWKHGTNNTYNKHGCRCKLCRQWRVNKHRRVGT
jgi:hypothetical protein